jgi:transposase
MIPTPGQTNKRFGIGAVNYHTGETVVIICKRKRREQITELLTQLLVKHPTQTVYVAWDNADTPSGGEIEAVVRGAAGRLVLLYLPTYSPWLNGAANRPIEMLWRHWRREVTHCELFESIKKLIEATNNFFTRYNQVPEKMLSIIGATRQVFLDCT